jgi:hypothetical protein
MINPSGKSPPFLHVGSALCSMGSSLVVIAWTLAKWGLASALGGTLPLLVGVGVGAVLVAASLRRKARAVEPTGINGRDGQKQYRRPVMIIHRSPLMDKVFGLIAVLFWTAVFGAALWYGAMVLAAGF